MWYEISNIMMLIYWKIKKNNTQKWSEEKIFAHKKNKTNAIIYFEHVDFYFKIEFIELSPLENDKFQVLWKIVLPHDTWIFLVSIDMETIFIDNRWNYVQII